MKLSKPCVYEKYKKDCSKVKNHGACPNLLNKKKITVTTSGGNECGSGCTALLKILEMSEQRWLKGTQILSAF